MLFSLPPERSITIITQELGRAPELIQVRRILGPSISVGLFLSYVSSCDPTTHMLLKMQTHTGCIYLTFLLQSGGCNGPQDWLRPGEVWPLPRLGKGMGQRPLRPLREAKGQGAPNVERPGVRGRPMRGGQGRPPMGAGSEAKYYWKDQRPRGRRQEAGSPRRLLLHLQPVISTA